MRPPLDTHALLSPAATASRHMRSCYVVEDSSIARQPVTDTDTEATVTGSNTEASVTDTDTHRRHCTVSPLDTQAAVVVNCRGQHDSSTAPCRHRHGNHRHRHGGMEAIILRGRGQLGTDMEATTTAATDMEATTSCHLSTLMQTNVLHGGGRLDSTTASCRQRYGSHCHLHRHGEASLTSIAPPQLQPLATHAMVAWS